MVGSILRPSRETALLGATLALFLGVSLAHANPGAIEPDRKFFPIVRSADAKFMPVADARGASLTRSARKFFPINRGNQERQPLRSGPAVRSLDPEIVPPPTIVRNLGRTPPTSAPPTVSAALDHSQMIAPATQAPTTVQPALSEQAMVPVLPAAVAANAMVHGWPIAAGAKTRISSPFGPRKHPVTGRRAFHAAVDIAAAAGTPILATADGTVQATGRHPRLGNYVMLRHPDGTVGTYGHMKTIGVSRGDTVARGQRIGTVGSTGRSTGPHLDFSLEVDGKRVDPLPLLSQPASRS